MAATTLAEARTQTRTLYLDDDATRWSNAEVDRALEVAISSCMDEYLAAGGKHFHYELDVTADSSGHYDLSALNPLDIDGVSNLRGSTYYPLPRAARADVRRENASAVSLKIIFVQTFAFPTTTSNPVIGDSVAPPTYKAFEEWVCVRAAQGLAVKDDEVLQSLDREEERLRRAIFGRLKVSRHGRPRLHAVGWSRWLAWDYDPRTQKIHIVNRDPWGI